MDSEFLSQVEKSKSKMKEAQMLIAEEQQKLYELVQSRGYKMYGNLYIHPDYWDEYVKHTWRGKYPKGAVICYYTI